MNPVDLRTIHKLVDRELSLGKSFSKGLDCNVNAHPRTKLEQVRNRLRRRIDLDHQALGYLTTFDTKIICHTRNPQDCAWEIHARCLCPLRDSPVHR